MSDLRETIAEVSQVWLVENETAVLDDYDAEQFADAIIAAIRANIRPLVWSKIPRTASTNVHEGIAGETRYIAWPSGSWQIWGTRVHGVAAEHTLDAAMAAANEHHVNAVMKQLGL